MRAMRDRGLRILALEGTMQVNRESLTIDRMLKVKMV